MFNKKEWSKRHYQAYKEKYIKHSKKWYQEHREIVIQRSKKWREKNKEKAKEYNKKYQKEWRKEKRHTDSKFRLDCNMATAIYITLKSRKAGKSWEKLVGYTLNDLIRHLEIQFDENMSWNNYGIYWAIDHIKPRSLFSLSEFKKCWDLNNLQPLEAKENRRKSNHWTKNEKEVLII